MRRALRWSLVSLLSSLSLAAVATAQPPFAGGQDPDAGAKAFSSKGCVRCHAIDGVGGKVGPDLGRATRHRSFADLASALWNHAPRMAARMREIGVPRAALDPREAGDIAAFLYTRGYFDPPGSAARGKKLFADKRCLACHAVGSTGGTTGPRLDALTHIAAPVALATAMWNHGARMAEVMARQGIPRPTFAEGELADLVAYVVSASARPRQAALHVLPGRAEDGRRLFADKGCAVCHARGARDAPDLAERLAGESLTDFATAMWNKAPLMTRTMESRLGRVPTLAPDEMAHIVAYLYTVRYFREAGDPRRGAIVATNKGCLDCHGLFGERGKHAGDLTQAKTIDTPAGVLAALWNHTFITDGRAERQRTPWPAFRAQDMADLIAYLQSVRRAPAASAR